MSWNASSDNVGVTAYDIPIAGSVVASALAGTSATVTGLSPNTAYSLTVRVRDAAGNVSATSSILSVTTSASSDTTPPSVPGSVAETSHTSSAVSLSWAASKDNVAVTGYEVFVGGSPTASVVTAGLTATVTGLSPATTYSFTVKARDAAGNRSAASTAAVVTTDAAGYAFSDSFNRANATLGAAWAELGSGAHQVLANQCAPMGTVTGLTVYHTA